MTVVDPSMTAIEICVVALGGMIGAVAKDIVQDGALQLPFKEDGKLFLGFIGGALVGAFVGVVLDGNFVSAALAGYTGSSILGSLLNKDETKIRAVKKFNSAVAKEVKETAIAGS